MHTLTFQGRVSLFQFPIKNQICRKRLEKYYPKEKLNKSARRLCLMCFSMAQFNDNIKFRWQNQNINDLMHVLLHISLIMKRFVRSFDRHSDKTVTLSELLLNINNFTNKIVDIIRKSHEFSFKIVRVIFIVVSNPLNFVVNSLLWRQSIATDTQWHHDLPPSCCWVHFLIFYTPCCELSTSVKPMDRPFSHVYVFGNVTWESRFRCYEGYKQY